MRSKMRAWIRSARCLYWSNAMKTPNTPVLPPEYVQVRTVDLQKNKKLALLVNVLALVIAAVLAVIGALAVPMDALLDAMSHPIGALLRLSVILFGTIAYIILHEAVHGIFMKHYGCGIKPSFGFTGLYAFAASRAYFNKVSYLIIGLSPVILWGIVLLILNLLLPLSWFWPIYFIQIMNLSGAAGDLYVTCLLLKAPSSLLVQDDGVAMRFYLPAKK